MLFRSILKRESPDGEMHPGSIPSVLEQLISEVESRGLTEVGICTSVFPSYPTSGTDAYQIVSLVHILRSIHTRML